jgi:hypothetical protein
MGNMKPHSALLLALILLTLVLAGAALADDASSLPAIREISYYPRHHAWLAFWEDWEQTRAEMDTDLDLLQALGANTVRIFVHPSRFNYPAPPTQAQLDDLESALQLIADHGLQAHVTLFDCWWSWAEIEPSRSWLAALVTPHRADPRIALWELQNEADLSQEVVRDWVAALFPYLKQLAGGTPCTVSVNDVEWLADVQALTAPHPPDVYSLHWYPSSPLSWTTPISATLARARELVGSGELLVGEFGSDTYRLSATAQADLYRDLLYTAHRGGVSHFGAWTLYDFPPGTQQCAADPAPPPELHFGLYRLDGSPKPAAVILSAAFHGDFPSHSSPAVVHNTSFEELNPDSGRLEDWCPWDERWSGADWFVQDCTTAHAGHCSVQVRGVPTMTVGLYQCPGLPIEPGRRYSLEGYTQAQNLDGWARLTLAWFDCDERWLAQDAFSNLLTDTQTSRWTRLSIDRVTPPAAACYYQVYAQVDSSDPQTVIWFDDLTTLVAKSYLPLLLK